MIDLSRMGGSPSARPVSHSHIFGQPGGGWFNTVNIRVFSLAAWNSSAALKLVVPPPISPDRGQIDILDPRIRFDWPVDRAPRGRMVAILNRAIASPLRKGGTDDRLSRTTPRGGALHVEVPLSFLPPAVRTPALRSRVEALERRHAPRATHSTRGHDRLFDRYRLLTNGPQVVIERYGPDFCSEFDSLGNCMSKVEPDIDTRVAVLLRRLGKARE